jgi:hypothetical protein
VKWLQYFSNLSVNVAFDKTATSSSVLNYMFKPEACKAVNGWTSRIFSATDCFHNDVNDTNPSWTLELGQSYTAIGLSIHRRDGDKNTNPPETQLNRMFIYIYMFMVMLLQDGGLETDRGLVSILNISETTCFYIK